MSAEIVHLELQSGDWHVQSVGNSFTVFWMALVPDSKLSLLDLRSDSFHGSGKIGNQVGAVLLGHDFGEESSGLGEVIVRVSWFVTGSEASQGPRTLLVALVVGLLVVAE